jgi:hypothetical protein
MTDSPATKIATFLEAQGFGTIGSNTNTTINVSREPIKPIQAITVYDTGGSSPDTFEEDVFNRTIKIRYRDTNYTDSYTVQENIRNALLSSPNISTINGIWMDGDILNIGRDDNDRILFTANYRLLMEG